MCFSFEVSTGTFLFSWISSLYLLTKKLKKEDRQSIIFVMIFSSMQFADAILWYIKMKKNLINYIVTSFLIPFILSLQIVYNVYFVNKENNPLLNIFIFVSICYIFIRMNGYSRSVCNNVLSSPIWGGNEFKLWELIIFVFIILYPSWLMLSFTIFIIFPLIYYFSNGAYGSLWCAIAALYSIYNLYKYS